MFELYFVIFVLSHFLHVDSDGAFVRCHQFFGEHIKQDQFSEKKSENH